MRTSARTNELAAAVSHAAGDSLHGKVVSAAAADLGRPGLRKATALGAVLFLAGVTQWAVSRSSVQASSQGTPGYGLRHSSDLLVNREYEAEHVGFDANERAVVAKTVFWDQSRVLFVAGLRTTGHDLWGETLARLCKPVGPSRCRTLCALSDARLWYTLDIDEFNRKVAAAGEELENVARLEGERGESGTIYIVNSFGAPGGCPGTTSNHSMAYPPEETKLSSTNHPDLHLMARLAERHRVDLRVVVMGHSDVDATIAQWVSRLRSDRPLASIKFLEAQAQALYAQAGQVPRFVVGADFDKMHWTSSLDEWTGIEGLEAALAARKNEFLERRAAKTSPGALEGVKPYLSEARVALSQLLKFLKVGRGGALASPMLSVGEPLVAEDSPTNSSSGPVLYFIAGLEGTGHHLWRAVFQRLIRDRKVQPACKLQSLLYRQYRSHSLWYSTKNMVAYESARSDAVNELKKLRRASGTAPFVANLLDPLPCTSQSGMMSYPNFGGGSKNLQRPNLFTLASLAQEAGVELRVILLLRPAAEIVASTIDNRSFQGGRKSGFEVKVLESNAQGLLAQLSAIGADYVAGCADYSDKSLSYVAGLGRTMGIDDLEATVRSLVRPPSSTTQPRASRAAAEERRRVRHEYISTLAAATEEIATFCPL